MMDPHVYMVCISHTDAYVQTGGMYSGVGERRGGSDVTGLAGHVLNKVLDGQSEFPLDVSRDIFYVKMS
jgi:hypothetical protein